LQNRIVATRIGVFEQLWSCFKRSSFVAASTDCFDTPIFCDRRHRDFREHVPQRFPVSSKMFLLRRHTLIWPACYWRRMLLMICTSVYILIWKELKHRETECNVATTVFIGFLSCVGHHKKKKYFCFTVRTHWRTTNKIYFSDTNGMNVVCQ